MYFKYFIFFILILLGGCMGLDSSIVEADKTQLKEEIQKSKTLINEIKIGSLAGQILEEDHKKLKKEIDAAELVLKKEEATQEKVDNSKKNLISARNIFKENIIQEGNKEELEMLISEVEKLLSETEIGDLAGQVPQNTHDELKNEVEQARDVMENDLSNQAMVDESYGNLKGSKDKFESEIIVEGNKEDLEILVAEVEKLLLETEIGDLAGQVPQNAHDELKNEVEQARDVMENDLSNQTMVDESYRNLKGSKDKFESEIIVEGNKEDLEILVVEVEKLLLETEIGDLAGQVSQNTHDELKNEVEQARDVMEDDISNQAMVEEAYINLKESKDKFKSLIILQGDKEKLKEIILEAEQLIESKKVGEDVENISQESKDIYMESIERAKQTFNDEKATQEIVDDELKILLEAKEELLKSEISIVMTNESQQIDIITLFGIECYSYDLYFQTSERTFNFYLNEGSEPKNVARVVDTFESKNIKIEGYLIPKSSVDSGNITQVTVKTHNENGDILEIKSFDLPK